MNSIQGCSNDRKYLKDKRWKAIFVDDIKKKKKMLKKGKIPKPDIYKTSHKKQVTGIYCETDRGPR